MTDKVFIENGSMFCSWQGELGENVVKLGEVELDVDGYYKLFLEPAGGYYDEFILLAMGEALKEANKPWDNQVKAELEILATRT